MFRKVALQDDFNLLELLLNESYLTDPNEFGIIIENCSFHNTFITSDDLKNKLISNREFYCMEDNGKSVGLIDSNRQLKEWYKSRSYTETGIKIFNHLPFNVCFID